MTSRTTARRRGASVGKSHRGAERPGKRTARAVLKDSDAQVYGATYDNTVARRTARYVRPYWIPAVLSVVAVLVFSLSSVLVPVVVGAGIDSAIGVGSRTALLLVALGVAGLAVVNGVSGYLEQTLTERVGQRVIYDLRRDMFRKLQKLAMAFSDRTPVGGLMSRMFGDIGNLQEMSETVVTSVGDLVTLLGIVVVLLILDWRLGLLTLAVVPALAGVRMVWQPVARRAFLEARRRSAVVGASLDQNVTGVRVVQASNRQSHNYRVHNRKVTALFNAIRRAALLGASLIPTVDVLTGTALAIVILVGGRFVLDGSLRIGSMVAFLLYVQRFFEPIRALTMHYSVLQRGMASGHRVFEVLDLPQEVADRPGAPDLGDIDGSVEFRNVTFGYEPERPVLKNISFRVEPGQTVAIVGPTGSGKTSITSLAHRFYDVQKGSVLLGGVDVRDVRQASIGRVVGMVLQEPFLFSGTVFENVRYARLDAARADVVNACKTVGAHEFIMKLSDGYDTMLGQRGANLSVGQRQLLSFARALVANPLILVLDEATANIDSYTEQIIQTALARLLEKRTALVIAHRLSTIRSADKIIVVNQGRIEEEGTHDELVASGGLYARLWSMNYASFDDLAEEARRQEGRAEQTLFSRT